MFAEEVDPSLHAALDFRFALFSWGEGTAVAAFVSTASASSGCLLKRPENLTAKQAIKLKEVLASNLQTIRAYLLKEEFQLFWEYISPA